MGEIIDIAGLLSLRTALDAADFEAPVSAERQALEDWNDQLDSTSPWSANTTELAGLLATAPAGVDQYTRGLLRGVLDARNGTTAAACGDRDYLRGYREGVASVRPRLVTA